ncbi:unnamed protein product [Ectocarpus fasciculatus]
MCLLTKTIPPAATYATRAPLCTTSTYEIAVTAKNATHTPTCRCDEELPETVMGVIRLVNLDIDMAEPLYHHHHHRDHPDSAAELPSTSARSPSSPRGRGRGR